MTEGQDTTGELLGTFLVGLIALRTSGDDSHTIIWEDAEGQEVNRMPVSGLVKGLVECATQLENAMGKDPFYAWLDKWLHASFDEREAMKIEAGLYPEEEGKHS